MPTSGPTTSSKGVCPTRTRKRPPRLQPHPLPGTFGRLLQLVVELLLLLQKLLLLLEKLRQSRRPPSLQVLLQLKKAPANPRGKRSHEASLECGCCFSRCAEKQQPWPSKPLSQQEQGSSYLHDLQLLLELPHVYHSAAANHGLIAGARRRPRELHTDLILAKAEEQRPLSPGRKTHSRCICGAAATSRQ